jgi:hypothetical protein
MPDKVLGIIGLQAEDVYSINGFVALEDRPYRVWEGQEGGQVMPEWIDPGR